MYNKPHESRILIEKLELLFILYHMPIALWTRDVSFPKSIDDTCTMCVFYRDFGIHLVILLVRVFSAEACRYGVDTVWTRCKCRVSTV
jgi:hypothetical protein